MRAQKPRAGERKAVLVPCGACTRAGRTGTSTYNSRTLAITLQLIADVQAHCEWLRVLWRMWPSDS